MKGVWQGVVSDLTDQNVLLQAGVLVMVLATAWGIQRLARGNFLRPPAQLFEFSGTQ